VLTGDRARWDWTLEPASERSFDVTITPQEHPGEEKAVRTPSRPPIDRGRLRRWLERSERIWDERTADVRSSNALFDRVLKRSLLDLRLLARYQAQAVDAYRDAQPGKILHEFRTGELAQTGTIPQSPAYYGTVDATLLFIILMAEYVNWSGDLTLARSLRASLDAALRWMDEFGDHDGDGYLDYVGEYENGLINQGWKDAGNAIVNADGSLARPPIALCEVQSYAYRARRQAATLLRALGDDDTAAEQERAADRLRDRFERDFWSDGLGCYVLALQEHGNPAAVAASNTGQVLWGGIASSERARQVAERLMQPDLFSGWGVRTLASTSAAFNPVSYHLGSVWPHDNGLIIAGLRRYGHDQPALRLFNALPTCASRARVRTGGRGWRPPSGRAISTSSVPRSFPPPTTINRRETGGVVQARRQPVADAAG
jgi:glycogen debranching enzyme